MENILIITPMGLEAATQQEIRLKHPELAATLEMKISPGLGLVELISPDLAPLGLNRTLRTPNRILLRLLERKCRDLPRLHHLLKKFNWRPYLKTDQIEFKVSCHRSRLMHTGRIEETARAALKEYFNANALSKSTLQKNSGLVQALYLRFEDDNLTIALDTSGDRLGQRGEDHYQGKAAIRENIAAGLLMELMSGLEWKSLALADPMCGSGTFLKEALQFFTPMTERVFTYEKIWPELPPLAIDPTLQTFASVHGSDIDAQVVKGSGLAYVQQADLLAPGKIPLAPCVVITNPPYGKRIKIEGEKAAFYHKILESIVSKYSPVRVGMIITSDVHSHQLPVPAGYVKSSSTKFFNSGIWVKFLIYSARPSCT